MIEEGTLRKCDPKQMAVQFYSPFYQLLSITDSTSDNEEKEKIADIFTAHIDCFIEKYATSKLQNNEDIQI